MLLFKKAEILNLLNKLKPTDEIQLVGDQGVYVMSFADPVEGRTIVYAQRCNPNTDPDWYDVKGDEFGYDDAGEELGTARCLRGIADRAKNYVAVTITSTTIRIEPR